LEFNVPFQQIETETFPRFHETETFGNYVSRPRLHPCHVDCWQAL